MIPNASIELDVYISNASHPLNIFEYTKENNLKGVTLSVPTPADGWTEHTWHQISIPISDQHYSFPMSTPWDSMDRLELYYADPNPLQRRGDYVRIRNVYLRSTRSYRNNKGRIVSKVHAACKDLMSMGSTKRKLQQPPKAEAGAAGVLDRFSFRREVATPAEPEIEISGDREMIFEQTPAWGVALVAFGSVLLGCVVLSTLRQLLALSRQRQLTPKPSSSDAD